MSSKLTCYTCLAYVFIVLSTAAHVVGLLTNYWFIGTSGEEGTEVSEVHLGLWKQHAGFENGTVVDTNSPLNNKEEQFLIVAVAGINLILCTVVLIKAIHICVGILSFIIMSLMLLCAILGYESGQSSMEKLQELRPAWPVLKLWWSFFMVFFGLILNILSTIIFLTILLIKGENEALNSSKGLGPEDVQNTNDKTPMIVSVLSKEDYAYDNDAHTTQTRTINEHSRYASSTYPSDGHAAPSSTYAVPTSDHISDSDNITNTNGFVVNEIHNSRDNRNTRIVSNDTQVNNRTDNVVTVLCTDNDYSYNKEQNTDYDFEQFSKGSASVSESTTRL